MAPATRHTIAFRLTLAVCAFLLLFQAVLTGLEIHYFKEEFKKAISAQQFTLLTVIAQDLDRKLLAAQKIIVDVSRTVTPAIASDAETAQHFLDNRPGTLSTFDNGLFLFSTEGRIIAESPYRPERRGRDIAFRQYFTATLASGQPVISAPYTSTHTPGATAIMFTAPVRDREGRLLAILGGSINLHNDNFLGFSRTRIAEHGYLYLFTHDRTVIMDPDQSRIMQEMERAGGNPLLDRALAGFEGTDEQRDTQGVKSLASFKHLQATDWILAANYPLTEAYAPILRVQKHFLVFIMIGTLLGIVVVRLMMQRYTSTLTRFAGHVQEIATKEGDARLFHCASKDEIGLLAATFNAMIREQDRKNEELLHSSTHDALTGIFNRAYFDSETARLARGRSGPISVVMADIDGLKVCNDTFGHAAGDALIRAAAQILLTAFRAEDIVARIGGDEFAILLPGVNAEGANLAMERVRSALAEAPEPIKEFALSLSLGTATSAPAGLEEAIRRADQKMYENKAITRHAAIFAP